MEISGQYLTYDEYTELGGTLAEMPFKILELEARQYVNKYTFDRLKELNTQVSEVKVCIYKLITLLQSYKNVEEIDKALSSESIDGYSRSFNNIDTNMMSGKNNEIKEIINTYLCNCKLDDNTPYLYRGF